MSLKQRLRPYLVYALVLLLALFFESLRAITLWNSVAPDFFFLLSFYVAAHYGGVSAWMLALLAGYCRDLLSSPLPGPAMLIFFFIAILVDWIREREGQLTWLWQGAMLGVLLLLRDIAEMLLVLLLKLWPLSLSSALLRVLQDWPLQVLGALPAYVLLWLFLTRVLRPYGKDEAGLTELKISESPGELLG